MRIENFGLPGSGKSTISSAVKKSLKASGLRAVNPHELGQLDADAPSHHQRIWRDPELRQSYHVANYLREFNEFHGLCNRLYADNVRNLALMLAVGADRSRFERVAEHLHSFWVDEGFLHLGTHALLQAHDWNAASARDDMMRFLDLAPRPDAVLLIRASVELATKGIFKRMPGKSPRQAEKRFQNAFGGAEGMSARAVLIDTIATHLRAEGVQLIEVDGHKDIEASAAAVIREIDSTQE